MSEQRFSDEEAARVIAEGAGDAAFVHHLRLRTDESGYVNEVPSIDGQPFPGIYSISVFTASDRPAIAVVTMAASVDFEGHTVVAESTESPPAT